MTADAPNPVFDDLCERAAPVILAGTHRRDGPPVDGGRWPVTVLARPPLQVRNHLEMVMGEAIRYAGPGHFRTGRANAVHVTIRALEPFREAATSSDPTVPEWLAAIERTAAATAPFSLVCTGVTLTGGGVLAQLEPDDDQPWRVLDLLRAQLGPLAWFEDQWRRRDIWYSSLLHFTRDVQDPSGLVHWVRASRVMRPVRFTVTAFELARFHYAMDRGEHYMRPETWAKVALGAL